MVLAGDQWLPRASGDHLRFARAVTYLLRHRLGSFVKGNKRDPHKKELVKNSLSTRQKVNNFPKPPKYQHPGISGGLQPIRHI